MTFENVELDVVGTARKVIVGKDETTIIEGAGSSDAVQDRMKQIASQAEAANSEYDRENYGKRRAALSGKVAVIKVGGATETEIEEKKYRVDDALLVRALEQPFRILLTNSGLNADEWLPQVKKAKPGQGVDVTSPSKLVDMKSAGIIDPTRVTKEALQNAASIAGTSMTMGALVVEVPELKSAPAPDMGGGMGMM